MADSKLSLITRPLHRLSHHPRSRVVVIVLAAVLFVGTLVSMAAPRAIEARAARASIAARLAQIQESTGKLRTEKAAHEKTAAALESASPVPDPETVRETYTEADIAYWRKQMQLFGAMNKSQIRIVGRGDSHFDAAIRLDVEILPAQDSVHLTQKQIALALDFLQAYGFVESFGGNNKATVHIPLPIPGDSHA